MKVRLKTLMADPEGVFPASSVIDPPDAEALISAGYAERLGRPLFKADVETAAVEPGSRAARPAARPRKNP